jgi:hypothetical protein
MGPDTNLEAALFQDGGSELINSADLAARGDVDQ